jgi:hypothetical protein
VVQTRSYVGIRMWTAPKWPPQFGPLSLSLIRLWVGCDDGIPSVAASEDDRLDAPESLLKVLLSLSGRRCPFREAHENGPQ